MEKLKNTFSKDTKNWLSIKSMGDLKTAWIGLAHSIICSSSAKLASMQPKYAKTVGFKFSYHSTIQNLPDKPDG